MGVFDKQYRNLNVRLGFAVLLMLLLLQGGMTLLGTCSQMLSSLLTPKAGDVLYWSFYNVAYFLSFVLPVPFFMLISRKRSCEPIFFEIRFPRLYLPLCVAMLGMITAAAQINAILASPFTGNTADPIREMLGQGENHMVVLVFIMLVLVPSFCEELLFRGLVLGNLLPYGKGVAILGSALLFAAMHQNLSQFLYTVVAGVLLGFLYVESRSIWPPTLLHMLNNLLSFVQIMILTRVQDQKLASRIVIGIYVIVMLAGAICALLAILHRIIKTQSLKEAFAYEDKPDKPLSKGYAVRGFFTPTVIVFVAVCVGLALTNLILGV